jgi:hypothetical protein
MGGLSTVSPQRNVSFLKRWCMLAMVILFLTSLPSFAWTCLLAQPAGGEEPAGPGMIQVTGHTFKGNLLVISYKIEYPGMTKIKLFNGNNELLWRSQRVDDVNGDHELVLKASSLNPGNYVFEFDYKNQKRNYQISM